MDYVMMVEQDPITVHAILAQIVPIAEYVTHSLPRALPRPHDHTYFSPNDTKHGPTL